MLHWKECVSQDTVLSKAYSAVTESVRKGKCPLAETQTCFLYQLFQLYVHSINRSDMVELKTSILMIT